MLLPDWSRHLRAINRASSTSTSYPMVGGHVLTFLQQQGMPTAASASTHEELTMNDKEIGGRIETTDDVQGHSASGRFIDGPDTDDVEGHSASGRFIDGPGTEDVEGHRFSGGLVADDTDDDTQGHGTRAGV